MRCSANMENHICQNQTKTAPFLGDSSNNMDTNISIYSFQEHSHEHLMPPNEGNELVLSAGSNKSSSPCQQHCGNENKILIPKRLVACPQ